MNAIEDYRTSVGIKLKRYMRDNDIKVELEDLISKMIHKQVSESEINMHLQNE